MLDPSEKGSNSKDPNRKSPETISPKKLKIKSFAMNKSRKLVLIVVLLKPPLERGPAGPKSLCNACGIKSRKKRRAVLDKKSKNPKNLGDNLKQRLLSLGRKVLMQKSTVKNQMRKLGEEEQAALLLMALSYGSVYA